MRLSLRGKRACAALLAGLMLTSVGAPIALAEPGGATADAKPTADQRAAENLIAIEIPVTQTKDKVGEGQSNYFEFFGPGWDKSDNTHHWTSGGQAKVDETYYEVTFYGAKIDIYAQKNWPFGMVSYSIDDGEPVKVGLSSNGPTGPDNVHTFDGLDPDSEHKLTARFTGEKDPKNPVSKPGNPQNDIDAGKVVVYTPEELPELGGILDGFISDVDTQWTNDRYGEAVKEISKTNGDGEKPAADDEKANEGVFALFGAKAGEGTPDDTAALSAWKNDAAISEITLATADEAVKKVTIEATDFTAEGGKTIKSENVDLSFIGSTKAYNGEFLGYAINRVDKPVPEITEQNRSDSNDVLLGDSPLDVSASELQNIFVKVNVPKDAQPGDYKGTVRVSAEGMDEPLEFEYALTVYDAELPDAAESSDTFGVELWQYPYSSAEYYGVDPFSSEHLEILKPIMNLYKSVGGNSITATIIEEAWGGQTYADPEKPVHYPSMIKWQMDENGQMRYDFTDFDAWVSFCRDEIGIGDQIIMYSILPWHNGIKYWDAGGDLKTLNNAKVGTAEGNRYWRHFLNALVEHLEEKGWFEDAYIGIDERGFCREAFDMIDSVKNSEGKSLKTAGAMDGIKEPLKFELAKRMDELAIGDFAAEDAAGTYDELLQYRKDHGLKTMLYSCTEHFPGNFSLSNPVETYWSLINAARDGDTNGFLRWAYDAWVDDPLNDTTHWGCEPGDCFLIYPGADKATIEEAEAEGRELTADELTVKSSIRMERLAEGVRDANKIKVMREDVTGMNDDVDAAFAKFDTRASKIAMSTTDRDWSKVDEQTEPFEADIAEFKSELDKLSAEYVKQATSGAPEAPTSVAIQGADQVVPVGGTAKLTVSVTPENALSQRVVWTSSNPDIATVGTNGTVTGHKSGITKITATSVADRDVVATEKVVVNGELDYELPLEDRVARYSFDENANADDAWSADGSRAAADAPDGEVNGNVEFVSDGKLGGAVEIDATAGEKITLPDGAFDLDGNKAWTVGYWVKASELNTQSLQFVDETGTHAFAMRLANDKLYPGFRVNKSAGGVLSFGGADVFEENQWYRVAWTNDPDSGLTMYVNGEKIAGPNTWTKKDQHGAETKFPVETIGGSGFKGQIDELAIYGRALTAEEIRLQMQEFSPESESPETPFVADTEIILHEGDEVSISGDFTKNVKFEVKSQENIADDAKNIENHDVVTLDKETGEISADLRGSAVITVADGDRTADIEVTVKRNVATTNQLGVISVGEKTNKDGELFVTDVFHPDDYQYDADDRSFSKAEGDRDGKWDTSAQYFGQPDMVRVTKGKHAGRLITAFPQGHGHGPLVMMTSDDSGETWQLKEDTPETWKDSLETPTMYVLNLEDGTERIMLITACPNWGNDVSTKRGWQTSYSDDGGDTWTEYNTDNGGEPYWPTMKPDGQGGDNPAVVGMASLIQLNDASGKPKQEWMGIFHHQGVFKNYKTKLTFEKKGGKWVEKWSQPEPLFTPEQQEIERKLMMCEIGMFRSPDGKRIVGLVRSQSHQNIETADLSTMIYSDDEGKTWSDPIELPGSLSGERHKALYDPISGRLVITFREMNFDVNANGIVGENSSDWICDDWGMWVGTYEQLMNQEDGEYRFRLDDDWVQNRFKGDCGYTGMTVDPETGMFVLDSYGHWDESYSKSWKGAVTKDLSYIRQARFTLAELLEAFGLEEPKIPLNVKVDFNLNYDDAPELPAELKAQVVEMGKPATEPEYKPVRDGYRFDGWYTEAECANKYDFSAPVEDNVHLFAKWTKKDVPVDPEPGKPDKSALGQLIGDAEQAKTDGKSDKVVAEFKDALANAVAVFEKEDATEDEIKAAFDRLSAALTALENDNGDGGDTPVDPDKPTDPDKPGDPGKNDPDKNDPAKPNGGGKPGDGLPGTGDDVLLYVGGAAAAGVAALAIGAILARKRKER